MGYAKLPPFDLLVLAGIDERIITRDWLGQMSSYLIFGVPAMGAVFAALLFGMRRTRKLYNEAAAREAAEQALRQSQKMEAVGQLTGGIAHDFNNLLTIILGNLAVATSAIPKTGEGVSDRVRRAVANAKEGAQRAATLTQRLLAFSRQQPLSPQVVDINAVLRSAVPLLQRALGESCQLEMVFAAGAWNAEIDSSQMEVALLNLVLNARDAMQENGKVTVECGNIYIDELYAAKQPDLKPGQYVVISVSDTGSGMTAETLSRAFDPFFTTKPAGQGTGLGLSQVFGFIKQSGGHVSIYSEVNQGTTVKLYLPRAYGQAHKVEIEYRPSAKRGNGEQILVVEDDRDVRQFVAEGLTELNYKVTTVDSAEQALLHLKAHSVALVITDIVMPGKNGRQLADEASAFLPALKFIFMTGYSRNAIVHHGRLDPDVDLLQKPFTHEQLARQVAAAIQA